MGFELHPGEEVLLKKNANHFRGIEAAGGKLRVTNQRLDFRANAINLQRDPVEIPIDEIADLRRKKTYGLIPNGLVVATKDGAEHQFVVWGRDRVIATVEPLLKGESRTTPQDPVEPARATAPEVGFCRQCGAKLRVRAAFCEQCGRRVETLS